MQDIQTVYRIKLIDQCCIQSSLSSTLVDHFKLYYHHPALSINKFDLSCCLVKLLWNLSLKRQPI